MPAGEKFTDKDTDTDTTFSNLNWVKNKKQTQGHQMAHFCLNDKCAEAATGGIL